MTQILVAAFLFGVLAPGFWCIATLNRFARLERLVDESWADVDVALKRRHDLIPNLVETVRAYADHERELLEKLIQAREEAIRGCAMEERHLDKMVVAVLAHAETFPDLKASENFIELQRELANSEDRIAAARRFYNANVREYNTLLTTLPSRILAGGRTSKEFYDARMRSC